MIASRALAAVVLLQIVLRSEAQFTGQVIPCKLDSSSLDCKCAKAGAKVVVNCGFMTFPRFEVPTQTNAWPADRQNIVTEFYLFQGTLRELESPSPFQHMLALKVLNIRSNSLRVIHRNTFLANSELLELNLENNSLTSIPAGVFRNNTKIKFLRLGSNQLASLPAAFFRRQPELEIVHLEDNFLVTLSEDLFHLNATHSLQNLQEIYLANNRLRQLTGAIFAGLPSITLIHLEVNPELRYIQDSVFPPNAGAVASITDLSMDGSPSYCKKNATADTIDCVCAEGFEADLQSGDHYCHPVDCGPRILDLIEEASASCGPDTEYGSTCNAYCLDGYSGPTVASPAVFECAANESWTGSISCIPVVCPVEFDDPANHFSMECAGDTRFGRDPCTATCYPGYEAADGTSSTFTCGSDGNGVGVWIGNLTCQRKNCGTEIQGLDRRAVYTSGTVCTGDTSFNGSVCNVRCGDGYGSDAKSYICGENGEWVPGTLAAPDDELSCAGVACQRDYVGSGKQLTENAVARCRQDISHGGDPCVLKCRPGYRNAGTPPPPDCRGDECVECRADGTWADNTLTCERHQCNQYMTAIRSRFDDLVDVDSIDCGQNPVFEDTCNVQCIPGYSPTGRVPNLARFTCDGNAQNTAGTWALLDSESDRLTCQILDCGDILETVEDPYASILNVRCVEPKRWDPARGTCSEDNRWSATSPATRVVQCGRVPPGLPQRNVYAEDITVQCSPIGWARRVNGEDIAINSTVCRTDCGNTLDSARTIDGQTGRISGSDFTTCNGDTGVGATCTSQCLSKNNIVASFSCGPDGVWQEVESDETQGLPTNCISELLSSTSTEDDAAIQAVTILIPLIVVIIVIIVLLYYFEYLTCLGLAVNKNRPGAKKSQPKQPKKNKVVETPVSDSTVVGGFAVPMSM